MCGIAGVFSLNLRRVDPRLLKKMEHQLVHRGPDAGGIVARENIGLINRRLAIIDLSEKGNQPMSSSGEVAWITFNGEIFNYRELRLDLELKGYKFNSQTDTEVVLAGYLIYGSSFFSKLNGQFAFGIWDKRSKSLILVRDQIGINPLYYAVSDGLLLFASEVKALLGTGLIKKEIDQTALSHYLSMQVVPAPLTIFSGIKSLMPGTYMIVSKNKIITKKYWSLPEASWSSNKISFPESVQVLRRHLEASVDSAKVSDVPVAAFLSGGIDSSTVVALLAKKSSKTIRTYSMWAHGGSAYDERQQAREISLLYRTRHTEFTVTEEDIINELPRIIYHFDQPTGGSMENYFISKWAGNDVKVALTGLGGDELFAGYNTFLYELQRLTNIFTSVPFLSKSFLNFSSIFSKMNGSMAKKLETILMLLGTPTILDKRLAIYFSYKDKEKKKLLRNYSEKTDSTRKLFIEIFKKFASKNDVDSIANLDLLTYTQNDLLTGLNMTSMAHSLETRVPLLDTRLVNFSATLPPEFKYYKGVSKLVLKEAVKDILPHTLLNRKKIGFGLPRSLYMRKGLKKHILHALDKKRLSKRGIFDVDKVEQTIEDFYKFPQSAELWKEHLRVWLLFIFELWCQIYIDQSNVSKPSGSLDDLVL